MVWRVVTAQPAKAAYSRECVSSSLMLEEVHGVELDGARVAGVRGANQCARRLWLGHLSLYAPAQSR